MKNKKIIGVTAMSLVLGGAMATANAAGNVTNRQGFGNPPAVSDESIQAEIEALKNSDYQAWKSAVEKSGRTGILDKINESNFSRYVEAFNLREQGDMDGSCSIMQSLGLEGREKGGTYRGFGLSQDDQTALKQAIENADYDAWKTVMEKVDDDRIGQYITQDNFNVIVRAYKLEASGDRKGAMDIIDSADLPGMLLGKGMHKGPNDMAGMSESDRTALESAYENGDYESWKAIMSERGGRILELVNADNFAQFAKAKLLQEDGKMDEAKTILDSLGFPFQERGAHGAGNRAHAMASAN